MNLLKMRGAEKAKIAVWIALIRVDFSPFFRGFCEL